MQLAKAQSFENRSSLDLPIDLKSPNFTDFISRIDANSGYCDAIPNEKGLCNLQIASKESIRVHHDFYSHGFSGHFFGSGNADNTPKP